MFDKINPDYAPVTILMIDHSPMMREAYKQGLAQIPISQLIIEVDDVDFAIQKLKKYGEPKLITYHLHTIDSTAVQKLKELKNAFPLAPMIVISGLSLSLIKSFCTTVGAECYIQHSSSLNNALTVLKQFLNLPGTPFEPSKPIKSVGLTHRQIQILKLMDQGYGNLEIANHTNLAIGTIKTHLTRINKVLGTRSRMQAVFQAKKKGFF
jgi:DNA-binding NarL/FixJ family response regulator